MNDAQIQRKLNSLVRICNELDDEARRRYGNKGKLFYESDGSFHLMDSDDMESIQRQKHVRFSSKIYCKLGAGAW